MARARLVTVSVVITSGHTSAHLVYRKNNVAKANVLIPKLTMLTWGVHCEPSNSG